MNQYLPQSLDHHSALRNQQFPSSMDIQNMIPPGDERPCRRRTAATSQVPSSQLQNLRSDSIYSPQPSFPIMIYPENQSLYQDDHLVPSAAAVGYGSQSFDHMPRSPFGDQVKATGEMRPLAGIQEEPSMGGISPSLEGPLTRLELIGSAFPPPSNIYDTPVNDVSDCKGKELGSHDRYSQSCRESLSLQSPAYSSTLYHQLRSPPQAESRGSRRSFNSPRHDEIPQTSVHHGGHLITPWDNYASLLGPTSLCAMPTHDVREASSQGLNKVLGPLSGAQRSTFQDPAHGIEDGVFMALNQGQQGNKGPSISGQMPFSQESVQEAGYFDNGDASPSPWRHSHSDNPSDHRAPSFHGLVPSNSFPDSGGPIYYHGDEAEHIPSQSSARSEGLSPYWRPKMVTDSAMANRKDHLTNGRVPGEFIPDLNSRKSASCHQFIASTNYEPSAIIRGGKRKRDLVPDFGESTQARKRKHSGKPHKRPFTDQEKANINWKRKHKTVCDECRKAKRKVRTLLKLLLAFPFLMRAVRSCNVPFGFISWITVNYWRITYLNHAQP